MPNYIFTQLRLA